MSASGAFLAKVTQTQFSMPPGKTALLYGVIAVPCAFLGNLLGERYKQYSNNSIVKGQNEVSFQRGVRFTEVTKITSLLKLKDVQ